MTIQTKTHLKSKFETGDKPTQQDFTDMLDSCFDYGETLSVSGGYLESNIIKEGYDIIFPGNILTEFSGDCYFNCESLVFVHDVNWKDISIFTSGISTIVNTTVLDSSNNSYKSMTDWDKCWFDFTYHGVQIPNGEYTITDNETNILVNFPNGHGLPLLEGTTNVAWICPSISGEPYFETYSNIYYFKYDCVVIDSNTLQVNINYTHAIDHDYSSYPITLVPIIARNIGANGKNIKGNNTYLFKFILGDGCLKADWS